MKRLLFSISILLSGFLLFFSSCSSDEEIRLDSPEGKCSIQFVLKDGLPYYRVFRDKRVILDTSALGFELKDAPALRNGFRMENASMSSVRERWEPAWGQYSRIRNYSHQLLVVLKENSEPYREMHLEFKAYDDGIAFRYIFPEQENLKGMEITKELSSFRFTEEMSAWWLPGNDESNGVSFTNTPLRDIDFVSTPLAMEGDDSLFLVIHEATLVNFPEMRLRRSVENPMLLSCDLVPGPGDVKARVQLPFSTPWRTVQLADQAGKLIESSLILNLNEPSKIEDASWVRLLRSGPLPLFALNEANADTNYFEKQTDLIFSACEQSGIPAIRTGLDDKANSEMPFQNSQQGVSQLAALVEKAAQRKIMVYAGESIKATGLERTWPNFISNERTWYFDGQPGVQSTLAKELALMVVNYSPYRMAVDQMEDYQGHPANDFIRELPSDWDDTRALNAKIGDYVTIARKKKDTWYIGSVSDENSREFSFKLDFLDEKLSYEAMIYADGPTADWASNPGDYIIEKKAVKKDDEMVMRLAAGGGQAVILKPLD